MDTTTLIRAIGIGTVLQIAMVFAGHFFPVLRDPGFAIGGMGLSALIGITVSVLFGDVPASLLALGTTASSATGAGGAVLARLLRRR